MDERFWHGIAHFNAGRFFEAHEALEELWHEYRNTDRTFIQALIQIAAGYYHHQCSNLRGSVSQLTKGRAKLQRFLPVHAGIDTALLEQAVAVWLENLAHKDQARSLALEFPTIMIKSVET